MMSGVPSLSPADVGLISVTEQSSFVAISPLYCQAVMQMFDANADANFDGTTTSGANDVTVVDRSKKGKIKGKRCKCYLFD